MLRKKSPPKWKESHVEKKIVMNPVLRKNQFFTSVISKIYPAKGLELARGNLAGFTPVHIAAFYDHLHILRYLVSWCLRGLRQNKNVVNLNFCY